MQAVAILDLTLLVAGYRQLDGLVHELDAEIEGLPRRNQPVEAVLRLGTGGKARLERSQPAPITFGRDQAGSVAEIVDDDGDGGRPHLGVEMVDEGPHAVGADAVRRGLQKIVRIVLLQIAEPAPIGGPDHPARALRQVRAGPSSLVEDVAGRIGACKRLDVRRGPLIEGKMLQLAHQAIPSCSCA